MANALGNYNEIFFAQTALPFLVKNLGMAPRVYMVNSNVPSLQGDTVRLRRPSSFTAAGAPSSTMTDVTPEAITLTLDTWQYVAFSLTDKELALSAPQLIRDHIAPMAYALADKVDADLFALYKDIPYRFGTEGTVISSLTSIALVRKKMNDLKIPDDFGARHFAIGTTEEATLLPLTGMSQNAGATDSSTQALLKGSLGTKFNLEMFCTQNVPSQTHGTLSISGMCIYISATASTVQTVKIYGDSLSANGTIKVGDLISVSTSSNTYTVTSTIVSVDVINSVSFSIYPSIAGADIGASAWIVGNNITTGVYANNLAFHRNAFGVCFAPLSTLGADMGARIYTVTDPFTGISLRATMYYVGDDSAVHVRLDVLYGVKTLHPELAVRVLG